MQIGRFFSVGAGRVGQFLSPRVLVVRSPFQPQVLTPATQEFCCFGFDTLKQAQPFMQSLSRLGLRFDLQQSQVLSAFAYEVIVWGETELARTLAFWDRRDVKQLQQISEVPTVQPIFKNSSADLTPAIAA